MTCKQSTVLRTFQGWLALSSTAPGEGTLKLFPDVVLSNSYLILKPFFRLKDESCDPLARESYEFGALFLLSSFLSL